MLIRSFEGVVVNHIDLSDDVLSLLYHGAHDLNLPSEVEVPLKQSESFPSEAKLSR
jgi:hypothetical protein